MGSATPTCTVDMRISTLHSRYTGWGPVLALLVGLQAGVVAGVAVEGVGVRRVDGEAEAVQRQRARREAAGRGHARAQRRHAGRHQACNMDSYYDLDDKDKYVGHNMYTHVCAS